MAIQVSHSSCEHGIMHLTNDGPHNPERRQSVNQSTTGVRKEKADGGDSDVRSKNKGVLFSAPAEKAFRVERSTLACDMTTHRPNGGSCDRCGPGWHHRSLGGRGVTCNMCRVTDVREDRFGAERVGAQGWAASGHLARVKHEQGQRREWAHPKFKTVIGLTCPCPHLPSPLPMPRQ